MNRRRFINAMAAGLLTVAATTKRAYAAILAAKSKFTFVSPNGAGSGAAFDDPTSLDALSEDQWENSFIYLKEGNYYLKKGSYTFTKCIVVENIQ